MAKSKAELLKEAQERDLDVTEENTVAEIQTVLDQASAEPDTVEEETAESDHPEQFKDSDQVKYHLDRDPNDPRTAEPTPKLPSLDDPETQTPEDYNGRAVA